MRQQKHSENLTATQESKVVGTSKQASSRTGRGGSSATRGGINRRTLTQSRFAEPQARDQATRATSAEPQPRQARPRAQPLPLRMKSQRILHKRLSAPIPGPGSSMEDTIVLD